MKLLHVGEEKEEKTLAEKLKNCFTTGVTYI